MLAAAPAEPSTLLLRTDMNEAIRCMHVNFQRGMLHHSINTMHFFHSSHGRSRTEFEETCLNGNFFWQNTF